MHTIIESNCRPIRLTKPEPLEVWHSTEAGALSRRAAYHNEPITMPRWYYYDDGYLIKRSER
jgi:hypothetical protein